MSRPPPSAGSSVVYALPSPSQRDGTEGLGGELRRAVDPLHREAGGVGLLRGRRDAESQEGEEGQGEKTVHVETRVEGEV